METSYQPRRLRRSHNRIIAGVCAGFAEWLRCDPLVTRVFFMVFLLVSWLLPAILVYLFCWTMMPKPLPPGASEPPGPPPPEFDD
ncbi:MAG: PspC domain-containing protein [Gammaproteobacteria bacterium]|jgi:phage shock protein PspC (stress-responsive transcriptional regulator)|nr:PspC domain-containing protein [Gammaproteobacteria bacterium]